MRTIVEVLPHDEGVIAALEAIDGDHPVGFGAPPDGALEAVLGGSGQDYIVLYPLTGTTRDGSLGDPYADIDLNYQATCVGYTANGVRWLVDQLEAAFLAAVIPGRSVMAVIPEDGGAVRTDTDIRPELGGEGGVFLATPRFRLKTTPAT